MTATTTHVTGQLDLLTGRESTPPPVVPAYAHPPVSRWVAASSGMCVDCLADQHRRHTRGLPTGWRRRVAVVLREPDDDDMPLCSQHARGRGWNPAGRH